MHARVLFDYGATHSFISPYFETHLGRGIEPLGTPIVVATPTGDPIEVTQVVRACPIIIDGHSYYTNLVLLGIMGFQVILGMDWLSAHHAVLDCREKTLTLYCPDEPIRVY